MTDIANSIGISKPALYWHFKNKDELFLEVVNYVRAEYLEKLVEISKQESMNAYEKLLQIIGFSYQKTFDDLNICVLPMKMLVEFSNKNDDFGAILRDFYADGIESIKRVLDEGVLAKIFKSNIDTWSFAMCLAGSMDGVLHQCILHKRCNTLEECNEQLFFKSIIESILMNEGRGKDEQ
ncbi:DNA-binding transcriptional repressor AcrR [Peptococcaceae bacterium CEB3]|nr:DNA-binding transcriptional repressor AcrR [Peptococcaceae bacterium CEB3]